jgi:hypothetical protein
MKNKIHTWLKNCRKQQLLTDPQHDVKNIFCLKRKYLHLLIYYLLIIFEGVLILRFLVKLLFSVEVVK